MRRIVGKLEDAGFATWAVGGAVRDRLFGLGGGDWDLASAARPKDVQRLFRRTVPVGLAHGTVGVLLRDNTMIEVTTFRRDVVPLGRKAIVAFADTIEEDLSRRDFTMNAIAWHPLREETRDPFTGMADIRERLLRCVGEAAERFREDHLRILRGIRFAGRFGLDIHADTWDAMGSEALHVRALSGERVHEELFKVMARDPAPSRSLALYRESGVWGVLLPEHEAALRELGGGAWETALTVADRLSVDDPTLRFAPILLPLHTWGGADGLATVLKRLRFSNAEMDRLVRLTSLHAEGLPKATGSARRRWLHRAAGDWRSALDHWRARADALSGGDGSAAEIVAAVDALNTEMDAGPPLQLGDLAVDGRDLKQLGLRPGPQFGEILTSLLEAVLDDPSLNDRDTLLARVAKWDAGP